VVRKLARQIGRLAPVLDVRVAFLGHAEPSLPAQLDAAGSGPVIVPLLLSSGYHLSADISDAATSAGARVAAPLGPDQLLLTALTARLADAGVPDGTPIVLAAAGSSEPAEKE
jgi:sirohydrochlorin ferrochelatase